MTFRLLVRIVQFSNVLVQVGGLPVYKPKVFKYSPVVYILWSQFVLRLTPGWGGGGRTPIIFSWGCAAGTLRTLAYTRPC